MVAKNGKPKARKPKTIGVPAAVFDKVQRICLIWGWKRWVAIDRMADLQLKQAENASSNSAHVEQLSHP